MTHDSDAVTPPVAESRAAEQIDRMLTEQERRSRLVESVGRDDSSAAQLAAMTPPPHDPEDIEAMRSRGRTRSDGEQRRGGTPERGDGFAGQLDEPDQNRWVGEGGALDDGPVQTSV